MSHMCRVRTHNFSLVRYVVRLPRSVSRLQDSAPDCAEFLYGNRVRYPKKDVMTYSRYLWVLLLRSGTGSRVVGARWHMAVCRARRLSYYLLALAFYISGLYRRSPSRLRCDFTLYIQGEWASVLL